MKKIAFLILTIMLCTGTGYGQEKVIKLLEPEKSKGKSIMQTLSERKSVRSFDTKSLSKQDLSNLLWAAFGINRPDGKRTAPTARDMREITIYALMKEGAYKYDAENHQLALIKTGDFRSALAVSQDYVYQAPVSLVIVADTNKFEGESKKYAWVDGGIVSQNINLFCAGTGLVTVPRGFMDKDQLRDILMLKEGEEPILNNPVGYPLK